MSDRPENACLTHKPPREGQSWRIADKGYRTCGSCYDRIHSWLSPLTMDVADRPDSIPGLYALLDPQPGHGDAGRRGPGFSSRSPASDHVISMRDHRSTRLLPEDPHSIPGVLRAWCVMLADERDLALPSLNVGTMAGFLDAHLDWITRQDWVDDLHAELRELHSQLKTAGGEPRHVVGACPNTIDEGEHTRYCGARLYAPLYGDAITCWACNRTWARREWLRLGDLLDAS